jgi:hypothetical protein
MRRKRLQTREPSCESYSDVERVATELGFDYVLGAKSTIIKRAIGSVPTNFKAHHLAVCLW